MKKTATETTIKKKKLSDAMREWLKTSKIKGIASLASALGEPTDSFRVRLSRNRWTRPILERLLEQTHLAESVQELIDRYEFEISYSSSPNVLGARVRYDLRGGVYLITAGENLKDQQVIEAAALSQEEINLVIACKMTQEPFERELSRSQLLGGSTLVWIWKISQNILNDVAYVSKMQGRLYDSESLQLIRTAMHFGNEVHIHFIVECPLAQDEAFSQFLRNEGQMYVETLNRIDPEQHPPSDLKPAGKLRWYAHCSDQHLLIDIVFDHCLMQIRPPADKVGWLLSDYDKLRQRLLGVQNRRKFTTLAVSLAPDDIERELHRMGYSLNFTNGWHFNCSHREQVRRYVVDI